MYLQRARGRKPAPERQASSGKPSVLPSLAGPGPAAAPHTASLVPQLEDAVVATIVDLVACLRQSFPAGLQEDTEAICRSLAGFAHGIGTSGTSGTSDISGTNGTDGDAVARGLHDAARALNTLCTKGPDIDLDAWLLRYFQRYLQRARVVAITCASGSLLLMSLIDRRFLGSWEEALFGSLDEDPDAAIPLAYLRARKERAALVTKRCAVPEGMVNIGRVCLAPDMPSDTPEDIARTVLPASQPYCSADTVKDMVCPVVRAMCSVRQQPCILVTSGASAQRFAQVLLDVYVGRLGVLGGMVAVFKDVQGPADVSALRAALSRGVPVIVHGREDGLAPPLVAEDSVLRLFVVHLRRGNMPEFDWESPGQVRAVWEEATQEGGASFPALHCPQTRPNPGFRGTPQEDVFLLSEMLQVGSHGLVLVSTAHTQEPWPLLSVITQQYALYRALRGYYGHCAVGSGVLPWSTIIDAMSAVLGHSTDTSQHVILHVASSSSEDPHFSMAATT